MSREEPRKGDLDLAKDVDAQSRTLSAEEHKMLKDLLARMIDGRLTWNYPTELFGVKLHKEDTKQKLQALREKIKDR